MNSLNKNPGTDAFDKVQKRVVPLIIVVAAVLAIWRNDVSIALLPLALVAAALYLLVVTAGARVVRAIGLKLWQRRQGG